MTAEQFYNTALELTRDGLGDIVRRDLVPDAVFQGMPEDMAVTLGVSAYNEVKEGEHMRGWLTPSQRAMLDETVDLAIVGEELVGTEPTTRIDGNGNMTGLVRLVHVPGTEGTEGNTVYDMDTWNVVYPWTPEPETENVGWEINIDFTLDGSEGAEPLPTLADLGWEIVEA